MNATQDDVTANHQKYSEACSDVAGAHESVRKLYERWAELEKMKK
jgi:hypothetical protein